jgi:hypothetical protein
MFRLVKGLPCLAALAGAFLLSMVSPARADFRITLQEGAQTPVTANGANSAFYSGAVGSDFSVTAISGSASSSSTNAVTQGAAFDIKNNGASAETLTITFSATGFTSPLSPPPLNILDTVSGSLVSGTVTGTGQGFAGIGNTLNETTVAGQQLSFSANGASKSFSQSGVVESAFSPSSAYSLTFTETFALSAGGEITVTGGNVQTVPTPAPPGSVLALTGLPFLGLGAWVRRRKAAPMVACS